VKKKMKRYGKTLKRQNHAEENFAAQRMYAHQLIIINDLA